MLCVVHQVWCATYWFTTAAPDSATDNTDNNMVALEQYRQGLARGDAEVMGDTLDHYFYLVNLPGGEVFTRDTLHTFLDTFKTGDKDYFMYFDNIIHKQVRMICPKMEFDRILFKGWLHHL